MRAERDVNPRTTVTDAGMISQKQYFKSDGVERGFCVPCLANGHSCEVQTKDLDGKFICVFCEDRKECPRIKMERKRAEAPLPVWKGGGRRSLRTAALPKRGKSSGSKSETGEETMEKLCKCGCGEVVNKHDYKMGHKKSAKSTDGGVGSASSSVERKPARRALSVADDDGPETVKVAVTGEILNAWFLSKSLKDKASIFEAAAGI